MKKSQLNNKGPKSVSKKAGLSKVVSRAIVGALIFAAAGAISIFLFQASRDVAAQAGPGKGPDGKKYVATRNIVVDRQTGKARKPTEEELQTLVKTLAELTKRDDAAQDSFNLSGGGEVVNVESGFGGTLLARPSSDGTMETRCVFSFEEAAEFLGLVEDNS